MTDSDVGVTVEQIVASFDRDRTRLMDIISAVQSRVGALSDAVATEIARALGIHYVEVLDTASFYAFTKRTPLSGCDLRFSRTPVSLMRGAQDVVSAFERAVGVPLGETSSDGITLSWTSDIGLADQEPACLIDGKPFTNLVAEDAQPIIDDLRAGRAIRSPKAGCISNIVQRGEILLASRQPDAGLRNALAMTPEAVIEEVSRSGLRGRGGAGFPTGMKWRLTRQAAGEAHYTICDADEGEPGTFKDRVLLAEMPDLVFEGMTIAGYALGARVGLMYLRAEYADLLENLQRVLAARRSAGLLGEHVCGHAAFDFDIRIQLGAGAYECGEESALIESLEGKRGAPRDRPPYPTDRGYRNQPSAVNNVETLACVPRILERGAAWFSSFGTAESKGTKLMCLSGDCERPGLYEVPFGITLNELLDLAAAGEPQAVQVSGPSGQCVAPKDFGRSLCFEDLSTAGSTMVFSAERDLLAIVLQFAEFFAEESCGWCVPCRVGTVLLKEQVRRALDGQATQSDLTKLERLGATVSKMSRCGLGQTAPNPILTTLRNFPHLYESRLAPENVLRIDLLSVLAE